ncbi:MAG TPA: C25 family cysteine peptidase, partial [Solirubrobacteraceae bacterium]|nr:C25 family cysteine peptidase [Solirubrobacteraceae bacterium]
EFLGTAATGVYTRTNVYRLQADPELAVRMIPAPRGVAADAEAASAYRESTTMDRNRAWSFSARGDDPWYDDWVVAFAGSPVERSYVFTVDHLVPGDATLTLDLWGMTDWPQGADHHVAIELNGVAVADRRFDGIADLALELPLPGGLLVEGENRLDLALPVDAGVEFEVVAVNRFGARYPRALVARDGELAFASGARSFTVDGLTGLRALGWQTDGARVLFLGTPATVPSAAGRSATFTAGPAVAGEPRFLVAQPSAIRTPALRAPALDPSLRRERAQYLVIAHPDFIPGLAPLVAARRAEGLTVRVADVEKVYGEFGNGRFGPEAIRDFIRYAARELGTEMVLLVGADTYDYLDFTGAGSISFVPTLYAETGPIVRRTPADAMYGDLDGDDVPDLAVGRLPVRTSAELAALVAKTLAYPAAGHFGRLVAAADAADLGTDFNDLSEASLAAMPPDWAVTRAYIDRDGVAAARSALIGALDQGVAWAQYVGHSSSEVWSFSGLLTRADADALTNAGRPAVFAQWGCWNTFFVTPEGATLTDRLLLAGDRGAAAVMGPAALASADSSREMSRLIASGLFERGLPLGAAVLAARRQIAVERPWMIDVVRGFNLLGDPALRLRN